MRKMLSRIRRNPDLGGRPDPPPSVRAAVAKFALGGLAALIVLAGVGALALARISRNEAIKTRSA